MEIPNGFLFFIWFYLFVLNDFVLETKIKKPVVFDMELAYILALGFKNVESIKIVSDNLSLKQYEKINKK